MKSLYSSVEIDASADRVWDILTDFAAYPTWNPFIARISGPLQVGARLEFRMTPPGGMAVTLQPTLLEVEPGRSLRWLGRLVLPGIFDGEHHFTIETLASNRSRFVQQERFTGVLVPVFASSLDRHTLAGFEAMNAALKARAEATPGATLEVVARRPEIVTLR